MSNYVTPMPKINPGPAPPPPPNGGPMGGIPSMGMMGSRTAYGSSPQFASASPRIQTQRAVMQQRAQASPYGASMQAPAAMNRPSAVANTGVVPGQAPGLNSVQAAQMQGPSLEQIQAEMARRQVGAQLGPRNAALSGYMMGQ